MEDSACVICTQAGERVAIGKCDHPVCLKCSARMRSLNKSTSCPVCREDLPQVVVSKTVRLFESFGDITTLAGNKELGMRFDDRSGRAALNKLFEARCKRCEDAQPQPSFAALKEHMRRQHQCYCCEICETHLILYYAEIPFYSRAELATHRRTGDTDGSSKGHPECEFCRDRYMDEDALYVHLREKHFWCHICERAGKQLYFEDYPAIRVHFGEKHYLCTKGDCADKKLTSVFATELDIQAHNATAHRDSMSRSEARQMRQLDPSSFFQYPAGGGGGANAMPAADFGQAGARAAGRRQYGQRRQEAGASSRRHDETEEEVRVAMAMSLSLDNGPSEGSTADQALSSKKGKPKSSKSKAGQSSLAGSSSSGKPDVTCSSSNSRATSAASADLSVSRTDTGTHGRSPSPTVASVGESSSAAYSATQSRPDDRDFPSLGGTAPAVESNSATAATQRQVVEDFPSLASTMSTGPVRPDTSTGYASRLSYAVPAPQATVSQKPRASPPGLMNTSSTTDYPSLSVSAGRKVNGAPPATAAKKTEDFPVLVSTTVPAPRPGKAKPKVASVPPGFASVVGSQSTGNGSTNSTDQDSLPANWSVKKAQKKKKGASGNGSGANIHQHDTNTSHAPPVRVPPGLSTRPVQNGSTDCIVIEGEPATPSSPQQSKNKKSNKSSESASVKATTSGQSSEPASASRNAYIPGTAFMVDSTPLSVKEFKNQVRLALRFNQDDFSSFTYASGKFYASDPEMDADNYYSLICNLFGPRLHELFVHIMHQLSDGKRMELLAARHNAELFSSSGGGRPTPPAASIPVLSQKAHRRNDGASAWNASAAAPPPVTATPSAPVSRANAAGPGTEDFPALGAGASAKPTASQKKKSANLASSEDFPALSSGGKNHAPRSGAWVGHPR